MFVYGCVVVRDVSVKERHFSDNLIVAIGNFGLACAVNFAIRTTRDVIHFICEAFL